MSKDYTGTIVEEGLTDNRIINNLEIVGVKISDDENPSERWHLYTVKVSKEDIEKLAKNLKSGKWYMHFWRERDIVAVFKDKTFEFNYDDKSSWQEVVEYGLSLGIPKEQLDFVIFD